MASQVHCDNVQETTAFARLRIITINWNEHKRRSIPFKFFINRFLHYHFLLAQSLLILTPHQQVVKLIIFG